MGYELFLIKVFALFFEFLGNIVYIVSKLNKRKYDK